MDGVKHAWELDVASSASIASRRALALGIMIGGIVLAVLAGIAGGMWIGKAAMSASLAIVAGLVWAATRLWGAPNAMARATVSVVEPGTLRIDREAMTVRSCAYDPVESTLWMRGPWGVPRACVRASREQASEIVRALDRPERGLRTLSATPGIVAIPFVGFLWAVAISFAALFGFVMLVAGPAHIGIPAAAIAAPLAILTFRPSIVHIGREELEWRWWIWKRRIPLASIERAVATYESLRVETFDGKAHRFKMRTAGNGVGGTGGLETRAYQRLVSFASFIETCARVEALR